MTLSLRRRAALVVAGGIVAAPLWLIAGVHAADQAVAFHGQPDMTSSTVSCPSTPDKHFLTVAAGATVDFVNDLGVAATLWSTDSHESLDLANGEMIPVTFTTGPATIVMEMVPDCTLDVGTHIPMIVKVTPADAAASASPAVASSAPSTMPSTGAPGAGASPTKGKHSGSGGSGGAKHGASPPPSSSPVPVADGADEGTGNILASVPTGYVTFGDPVSAAHSGRGASGLLTLIATVSVGGVTVAALRAIVAQRSTPRLT
ncbi:MAG TPA: hypothetical protein VFR11_03330 [Micromonosporaceae bacterium]|jgi:hypothetical protein|nr:hypothetical protein [Micromonosporaceae bacterium]